MKGSNEVNISNPTEAQQAQMNPYKFLTLYKSGYAISMTTSSSVYNIHLKAQNSRKAIKELSIAINKRTNTPTSIKMLQGSKWTTITINKFANKTLNDGIFTFNRKDFPSAEVIDLR